MSNEHVPGNVHVDNFKRLHDWLTEHQGHEDTTDREVQIMTAEMIGFSNLAVAYELRTQNLIATLQLLHEYEQTETPKRTKAMPNMEKMIQGTLRARLELDEEA